MSCSFEQAKKLKQSCTLLVENWIRGKQYVISSKYNYLG